MKFLSILIFLFVSLSAFSQATEVTPQVVEKDGNLVYVIPAQAAQEVVLTVEMLEQQQKAIKERKDFLEKQSKAIQDEYNALTEQESKVKDYIIAAYKLQKNTPVTTKPDESKNNK